jgi:hypothetical protein
MNPLVKKTLVKHLTLDSRPRPPPKDGKPLTVGNLNLLAIPDTQTSPSIPSVRTTTTPFSASSVFMPNIAPPSPLLPDSMISKILSTQSQTQLQMQEEITKSLSGMEVKADISSPTSPADSFLDLYDYAK